MYLIHMRPDEIRDCVKRNVPVIMATGVVEYHGPHLPVGTDILISSGLVHDIEKKCECIVAPDISYGTTMNWAGSPKDGNIDFNSQIAYAHTKEILKGLIKMGFRRIYLMQHHQGNGEQHLGMLLAARECADDIAREWEDGWGRLDSSCWEVPHIFECIQVLGIQAKKHCSWEIEVGHGSKGETQLIEYYHRQDIDMSKLEDLKQQQDVPQWLCDSHLSDVNKAKMDIDFCVNAWIEELTRQV